MVIGTENGSFDELELEISLVKGGPGHSAGGWVHRQSGGPLLPGGECFAPCHKVTRSQGHKVTRSQGHKITRSQGHKVTRSQDHKVTSSQGHKVTMSQSHKVTT